MKRWKRRNMKTVSLLLVLLMTLSSPLSIFAAETKDASPEPEVTVEVVDEMSDVNPISEDADVSSEIAEGSTDETEASAEKDGAFAESDEVLAEDEAVVDEDTKEAVKDAETSAKTAEEAGFLQLDESDLPSSAFLEIEDNKKELAGHLDEMTGKTEGSDFVDNEIVVEAPDEETAVIYAESFGGKLLHYEYGYALIGLNDGDEDGEVSVMDAVLASADPEIMLPAAWPNYIGRWEETDETETDVTEPEVPAVSSGFESIYSDPALNPDALVYQWMHYQMQTECAWRSGYKGQGVKVAVLDSGVLDTHEDLKDHIKGKGHYDYDNNKLVIGSVSDSNGHGTHCTGIVGAICNNGKGGAGIAPESDLYMIAVCGADGLPTDYGTFLALNYAVSEWNTDVVSMSLSFGLYSPDLSEAVENAYNKGTAVFCASGNDCSDLVVYPAMYTHSIAVGAVDSGNAKAYFSNQNSKVRYSGPGVNIYSTYNDGGYTSLRGTSMACPAVAGAAAVVLSSGKVTASGSKRVDQLLALMDKSCVKSGVGKGTPDLSKLLATGSMTTGPAAPVATPLSGTYPEDTLNVTLKAIDNSLIFYTLDGSRPIFKNGFTSGSTKLLTRTGYGSINIKGAAKITVRAIAVNNLNGLAGKEAVYTYNLQPPVSNVELSAPNDVKSVKKGGSIQLNAQITPFYAKNKQLKWEVVGTPAGVSVSKTGKVSVAKTCAVASFDIKATSTDGSDKFDVITISVNEDAPVAKIKPAATAVTLYNGDTETVDVETTVTGGDAPVSTQDYVNWTSSDPAVASCSVNLNLLTINGLKAGSAVITGLAKDGSGKKCTIKVTVYQRVTSVSIERFAVAAGKSVKPSFTVYPENAKNKKLSWEITEVPGSTTIGECGVTVNKSTGQIKASAKAVPGRYGLICTSAAPSVKSFPQYFNVVDTAIKGMTLTESSVRLFRQQSKAGVLTQKTFGVNITEGDASNLAVKSSLPGIVDASISGTTVTVTATGNVTGTANVTVYTTDGSNIKKTVKVTVANPPSKLYLSLPGGRSEVLQYGKTLKLKPVFVQDYGPVDATTKKLKWTSSNTNYLTVSQSGVVKAVNTYGADGPVEIKAETTDGSNLSASCLIYPNAKMQKIIGRLGYDYVNNLNYILVENYCNGIYWNSYTFSIKGAQGGMQGVWGPADEGKGNYLYIYGYKKGIYSVKITRNDGSGKSTTLRIKII